MSLERCVLNNICRGRRFYINIVIGACLEISYNKREVRHLEMPKISSTSVNLIPLHVARFLDASGHKKAGPFITRHRLFTHRLLQISYYTDYSQFIP